MRPAFLLPYPLDKYISKGLAERVFDLVRADFENGNLEMVRAEKKRESA